MKPWRAALQRGFKRWAARRLPRGASVTLSHRSIFIVPTRAALGFLLLLALLLVCAINFRNSLLYALTFWLFSVGLLALLFTYRNLAGLTLRPIGQTRAFVGDAARLTLQLSSPRGGQALGIGFQDSATQWIDVLPEASQTLCINCIPIQRGHFKPEPMHVKTQFPLGLFHAWSWVALDWQMLVYPKPEFIPFSFIAQANEPSAQGAMSTQAGQQDVVGVRPYQRGDAQRYIAWKQVARGKGMVSKLLDQDSAHSCWLDWHALAGLPLETRLSRLCGWVLQAHENGWHYGLSLPGQRIAPDYGETHLEQCLTALALFATEPVHE